MQEGLRRIGVGLKVLGWVWLVCFAGGGIAYGLVEGLKGSSIAAGTGDALAGAVVGVVVGAIGFMFLWGLGWIVDGFAKKSA